MRLVIFDWDGTLCDSTAKITRCVQIAADSIGLPALDEVTVKGIIGLGLFEACQTLYPNIEEGDVHRLAKAYSYHFLQDEDRPPLYSGALELMEALRGRGVQMAIATGKSRKGLNRILDEMALAHWFDFTRCADETASKPNPLMLNQILAEAQCRPHQAVMIGDTEFDLAMAGAIEMPCIGVTYGAHPPGRLHAHAPVLMTNDLRECLPWIEARLGG